MANVQAKSSAWRQSDLAAEIAAALPDPCDGDVRELLDGLTDDALASDAYTGVTAALGVLTTDVGDGVAG